MRKWILMAAMLGMVLPLAAQKGRYSSSDQVELEYPLTANVVHAWLVPVAGAAATENGPQMELHLDAIIDGTKYELRTSASGMLHPGEYRAREMRLNDSKAGWYSRSYELLFTDGTHVVFKVVGETAG
ncbi:MAG: hypothetical protein PW735_04975 [Acidobacteriaceae bacterium]|nr:hypothetical protein [Acidobacteriaceae bacterium]